MLINAVVLQEAKDSSEIENIITTQDELYKALVTKTKQGSQVKKVINYRKAIFLGNDLLKKQGFLRLRDIDFLQKTIDQLMLNSMAWTCYRSRQIFKFDKP